MDNTKVSKLLLAWLVTQGHEVHNYEEGKGITTRFGKQEYSFNIDGSYSGYRVVYSSGVFSFYDNDNLIKQTDLNEFR